MKKIFCFVWKKINFKPSFFFLISNFTGNFDIDKSSKIFWIDLLTQNSHINNIALPIENLFTQTLHQKSKTMQGWLPLCCGDNWDLFTVKRKWIFTITARSRYRCSASPASISRIFSRKKLSYCMLKDMSFWNPIYVVFHSGFKLLKPAEKKFTWRDFTKKFQAFKRFTWFPFPVIACATLKIQNSSKLLWTWIRSINLTNYLI